MKKWAFFVLFVCMCFLIFAGVYAKASSFDLSNFFVQTIVQKGEIATGSVQFINLAHDQNFYFHKQGSFFNLSNDFLFVNSSEGGVVSLGFDKSLNEGVYVGNIILSSEDGDSALIPVILGIKSKKVLFDVAATVSPQFSIVAPGERLVADVKLYNLGSLDRGVNVSYNIVDLNNSVIFTDSQIVQVVNKVALTRDINLPKDIPEGDYLFYATASKGESFGLSSFLFSVSKNQSAKYNYSFFVVLSIAILLLLLFLFFSWIWNRRLANSAKYWDNKVSELKNMKTGNSARKLRKLEYELQLLEKAHSGGYVKKDSYETTRAKLLGLIRESKKRL